MRGAKLLQLLTPSYFLRLLEYSPNLERVIAIAIGIATKKSTHSVVERICAIAFFLTKELLSKEVSKEHDPGKFKRAAMQMLQQVAGFFASVTSKEPLRVAMWNQLCTVVSPNVVAYQNMM